MGALPDLAGRRVEARDRADFLATYGHLFDHSPWVVERAWELRPFTHTAALHTAFLSVVEAAPPEERLALLRAHPELADKVAMTEGLTAESAREQASAGLDRLSPADYERFHGLNRAYRQRFGFPFIVCVRLHDQAGILAAMQRRLDGDPDAELVEALAQVGLIVRLRLAQIGVSNDL
jgi:2-oxo-4-hydroxy-4-carboxy-5-ureidoimidazoline decarboxylase